MAKIAIDGTDIAYSCDADDTVLRAALRAGVAFPYECNVGSCGTCKMELLEGEIETLWADAPGLNDRDKRKGRKLACQSRPLADCRIKIRLDEACRPFVLPRRFDGELAATRDLTADIREFRFRAPGKAAFLPGQYALLNFAGVNGPRAYSMSNIANDDGLWDFQIRVVPGGAGTGRLFAPEFKPGAKIALDGPYGIAYLRTDAPRDIVCIGGGSGLAPMISIARGFAREPALAGRKLYLFYGARGPADVCGEDMLRELPGFGTSIVYEAAISMPELDIERRWIGKVGFVHDLVRDRLGAGVAEHEIYMAGPPPMVMAAQNMLVTEFKVPFGQIHFDRFF